MFMPGSKINPDIRTADKAKIANVLFIQLNKLEDILKPFGDKNFIEDSFVYENWWVFILKNELYLLLIANNANLLQNFKFA